MTNVTDQILSAAIESLPPTFDTHAVIREVMTRSPREYADDLGATPGSDPILTLHASIGSRLAAFDTIAKTRKVSSTNVRGQDTENQEWKKKQ